MLRETLMIYLITEELLLSVQWVAIKLIPPHTWSMRELFFMMVMVITFKLLSKMTMQRLSTYQMTILNIQVNVTLNTERLNPTLCTMMRLTLILLMQVSFLPMFQPQLNQWNLVVER